MYGEWVLVIDAQTSYRWPTSQCHEEFHNRLSGSESRVKWL